MLGKVLLLKITALLVFFPWLVNSKELLNNKILDQLEKCGLFSDFQYGFSASQQTPDLLTVVSDRIATAFNRSRAAQVIALDISKAFGMFWDAGIFCKPKSYEISVQMFGFLSSFLSKRWCRVVLDWNSSQEYLVNEGVPPGSTLGSTPFLLYINDLPDDIMCNIAVYADDTTFYSNRDQASGLRQQLELAFELEFDLRDTYQIFIFSPSDSPLKTMKNVFYFI